MGNSALSLWVNLICSGHKFDSEMLGGRDGKTDQLTHVCSVIPPPPSNSVGLKMIVGILFLLVCKDVKGAFSPGPD